MLGKRLPMGIENFNDIRTEGYYYVDKTGLIRELVNVGGKVNLFTRPRRFGKTLNMSMLRAFFEIGTDKELFENLEIFKEKELCDKYMGQFPVVFLSLKGAAGRNFEEAYGMLGMAVKKEILRLQFLLDSEKLTELDKQAFRLLCGNMVSPENLKGSLWTISNLLYKHYDKKVILLIDEYDVPLDKAYDCGYYDEMVSFIRGMFDMVLKTNDFLQFAVLTGCLRISKESIFTGLNNFSVHTITNTMFDEYFGFTDREVRMMLEYYGLSSYYDLVKEWYDGYRFGSADVYCPWDVISYLRDLLADKEAEPQLYWINTSSNSIVRRLISRANKNTQKEIEQLIEGESITKEIKEELTYSELDKSIENLWSVLFTTGYLTWKGKHEGKKYQLAIPNREIREIFVIQIKEWFAEEIVEKDRNKLHELCTAFKNGNAQKIQELFNSYLLKTISIRDTYVRKEKRKLLSWNPVGIT